MPNLKKLWRLNSSVNHSDGKRLKGYFSHYSKGGFLRSRLWLKKDRCGSYRWSLQLNDTTTESNRYGLGSITGLQFGEDILDVHFHCIFGNKEQLANLFIGFSSRY